MSSIVSKKKIRIDIPEDIAGKPGQWVDVIKLSGKKEAAARLAKTDEHMHTYSQMSAAFVKALQEGNEEEQKNIQKGIKKIEKDLEFDLSVFDLGVLLQKSIRGWSFAEPLGKDPYDQINMLTSRYIAEQIVELLKPPTKAKLKNAAGGSISS